MAEQTPVNWEKLVRRMERLLRLKSFPVAFKMLADKKELGDIAFLRRPGHKMTMCQMITLARNFDWTVGAEADDLLFSTCSAILGLDDLPDYHRDGTFRSIVWVQTKADGRRYEEAIPRLPRGRYQAVAMAPLVYNPFDPDIVLVYGNPAQMMLLINALQFADYQVMQFYCVGESSCADAIARCYLEDKPSLAIPCYGERRYGHAQDDELVMALPAAWMPKALAGLEVLYRRGVRYPICYAGAEIDIAGSMPPAYHSLEDMVGRVRRAHRGVLAALTGSIATGKSTVARMLTDKGARLIDFDLIAHQVVEPGRPAFDQIVDYFGKQVLGDDGAIDRQALSDIVFKDMEKRKKLESFTHPRIYEEFFDQLSKIGRQDPEAVVIVDVPLLIELNLGYLFPRIIVVRVSPQTQLARLMQRDGISEEAAATILKAQLPADEKAGFADVVIDNDGTLEETAGQVEKLWQEMAGWTR